MQIHTAVCDGCGKDGTMKENEWMPNSFFLPEGWEYDYLNKKRTIWCETCVMRIEKYKRTLLKGGEGV